VKELFESMEYGPAPESRSEAEAWIEAHERKFGLFIGGNWAAPSSNDWMATYCPSTGSELAQLAVANQLDINNAVASAKAAFPVWSSQPAIERAKVLYAIARQVQKHSRLFATLESLDNGKPIRETRDIDIPLVARHFYHHAGWAQLVDTEFNGYEPLGVVGQIIPWNFPLLMLAWKIAPALAAGNCVILKPAEFTSLTALLFAEICEVAGVPAGVVNIVTGGGETGRLIVEHPEIAKIAFTGSTEVGRIIRNSTAGTGKKLSLELGGKSPFIVFEDADLDSAVEGVVDAIWFNQGQVCCAGSRLLVHEGVADRLLTKLKRRMETLRVGDPLDKAIDIGAIVDSVQLQRITELVETGVNEGASKFQPKCTLPEKGWFFRPTLLTNVSPASTVAQVEIFGPVLVAMTFRNPAEAVALANNTVFGLASSVWTENINLAHDIAGKIKAGTVWINCTNQFDAAVGFGGYRESGFGREGGKEGMFEYLSQRKTKTLEPKDLKSCPIELKAGIDRTYKQYIGGKQARPDGGYSDEVVVDGKRMGEVARGNRKDIRNAVEAAISAQSSWCKSCHHARAQILYFLAENFEARKADFVDLLGFASQSLQLAEEEVRATTNCLFRAAAWADKFDGSVHSAAFSGLVYTRNEPIGTLGIVSTSDQVLLGTVAPVAFAIAMANTVIAIPSAANAIPVMEFVQVLETSDVPAGVVNLVTGPTMELAKIMAEHEGLDGLWSFGTNELTNLVESSSISNLKQTWCVESDYCDWKSPTFEKEALRKATQVKNIWTPAGE
jgi:aldehyde dehydrogenase (NAD+)